MTLIMEQGTTIHRLSLQISDLLTKIDRLTAGAGMPVVRAGAPMPEIANENPARRVTYDLGDDKARGSPKMKAAAKSAAAAKPNATDAAAPDELPPATPSGSFTDGGVAVEGLCPNPENASSLM